MGQQSNLEKYGIAERDTELLKDTYTESANEYSATNKDAISDGDPQGKGTGLSGGSYSVPNSKDPINLIKPDYDTTAGGGSYDINGVSTVTNSGRKNLTRINIYNSTNAYSAASVDTTQNKGQVQI